MGRVPDCIESDEDAIVDLESIEVDFSVLIFSGFRDGVIVGF